MGCSGAFLRLLATILTFSFLVLTGVNLRDSDRLVDPIVGTATVVDEAVAPTSSPTPPGDVGYYAITGTVFMESAGGRLPAAGVQVEYMLYSRVRVDTFGSTITDGSGYFEFNPMLVHDTDMIAVRVEVLGYEPQSIWRPGMELYAGFRTFTFALIPMQPET